MTPKHNPRYKKILIVGLGRSGTSAVASAVSHLGYYMGGALGTPTIEDVHLRELLKEGKVEEINNVLAKRAKEHDLVAWKEPKLFGKMGVDLWRHLDEQWLYVALFRDPYAIAMRNHKSMKYDLDEGLWRVVERQRKLAEFCRMVSAKNRTYKFSYEKLVTDPVSTLTAFVEFLGIAASGVNMDYLQKAMSDDHKRYLDVADSTAPL